jgi:hypothetical protein
VTSRCTGESQRALSSATYPAPIVSRFTWTRNRILTMGGLVLILALVVGGLLLTPGGPKSTSSSTSPSALVLSKDYSASAGFPKVYQAAKKEAVSSQKGCLSSVEAVYEDTTGQTALLSSVVNCSSVTAAASALAATREEVAVDPSIKLPKLLGQSAFATASQAPEYVIAWRSGSKVAFTAIDVNIAASSSTSTTTNSNPLTKPQERVLINAAIMQNSLYQ